ncbi:MAG: amidophosphoribosyltransferase [Armatimonadetes bacterium]|nr:MAG: amidophosphoribosyltransferase [Armatimonadota bacterium]
MKQFIIRPNHFLKRPTQAFYRLAYVGFEKPDNPDFLNHLKNQYGMSPHRQLQEAAAQAQRVLAADLPKIPKLVGVSPLTVCVVPRAWAERSYSSDQLLFRESVRLVAHNSTNLVDGTTFIKRHTDTKTTHLRKKPDLRGAAPYPGITCETCHLSIHIRGRDILLVDDIYTLGVNVDEDAIQALYDAGARSVTFYAVARTGG